MPQRQVGDPASLSLRPIAKGAGGGVTIPVWERWATTTIVAAYVALAIGFSLGPILEAPDEPAHYRFARGLAETRALPDPSAHANVQDHQAPLYYLLLLPPVLLLDDTRDPLVLPPQNPFWGHAFAETGNDNKNLRLHWQAEQFPYSASRLALAIHVARLVSVALGALTLIVSTQLFRMLWPDRPDLRALALGIAAFWPQFDWLSGVLNNDSLLILVSTTVLWLLLRQLRDGSTWRGAWVLGLALAAALLSKASALILAIPVGVVFLLDIKAAWRQAAFVLGIVLALAGWWYVRNWLLVGNISGWDSAHDAGVILPGGAFSLRAGLERLPFAYQGLWARFGNVSVPVSGPIYALFDALVILSLAGLAMAALQSFAPRWRLTARLNSLFPFVLPRPQSLALLAAFVLAWLAALIYLAGTAYVGNQGRYILPALAGVAALLAMGLGAWIPRPVRRHASLSVVSVLAAVSAACLFGYFYPAFRPSPATPADHPLGYRFGDVAKLVGVSPALPGGRPGETITITLHWKALRPADAELITYLHTIDSDIVRRDSYPATGNLRATEWQAGQMWDERYIVTIPADAEPQTVVPLTVGFYEAESKQLAPAFDPSGAQTIPIVGRLAVHGPAVPFEPVYRFGGVIGMAEPEVTTRGASGQAPQTEVCLRWVALGRAQVDYHVFVHALDANGLLIAQSDFQPKQGRYPTGAWQPGETIEDCVALESSVPPAKIATGLYDAVTGERLPVIDSAGRALDNAMIVVAPGLAQP